MEFDTFEHLQSPEFATDRDNEAGDFVNAFQGWLHLTNAWAVFHNLRRADEMVTLTCMQTG